MPYSACVCDHDYQELDELYDKLKQSESKSLLKKHLTQVIYNKLKSYGSIAGANLEKIISYGKIIRLAETNFWCSIVSDSRFASPCNINWLGTGFSAV